MAAAVKGGLHHPVRGGEGLFDLAGLVQALEAQVVAERRVNDDACRIERGLHVHGGRQRLIGDGDFGRGVLGNGAAVGHHRGDGLAHPGGPFQRQGQLRRRLHALEMRQHRHPGLAVPGELAA